MCNVIKENIIDVFMGYFGDDVNLCLCEVMGSFVKYLYDFVCEVNFMYEEWNIGIVFLECVGEILDVEWYEFVLLFDVLGFLFLVDMLYLIFEGMLFLVFGFFYIFGFLLLVVGGDMCKDFDVLVFLVEGMVKDIYGNFISGVILDIW